MEFHYAVQTHPGRIRENNEDNYFWNGRYRTDVSQGEAAFNGTDEDGSLLGAVCDGMGGEANGELASLMAVRALKAAHLPNIRETAEQSVREANQAICNEIMRSDGRRMGSTLAALYMDNGKAVCCNIGDSRIYQLRDQELTQLTVDQSQAQKMVELGVLTPEQGLTHQSRHVLTQHLGIFEEEMILVPDFSEPIQIEPDDVYLICSDGLTDMVRDDDIRAILLEGTPQQQAQTLVDQALAHGGRDNVTVIVIQVKKKDTLFHRLFH